jgi:hypothetical protein
MKHVVVVAALSSVMVLAGCSGQTSLLPNSDPKLRRTPAQFAADAAKRHPFKANMPSGGEALGRAEYNLTVATLQILNYSDEDWDDVEVWVNKDYVCYVPKIEKGKARVKTLDFQMLFDDKGEHFWTNGGKTPLNEVNLVRNGKMYTLPTKLAE